MTLDEIRELSVYRLASDDFADCGSPDSRESVGAKALAEVRDNIVAYIEENPTTTADDIRDQLFSLLDGVIDYRTHQKWLQFVDLAAYSEESESEPGGQFTGDLNDIADAALGQIFDRLANRIIQEWEDSAED